MPSANQALKACNKMLKCAICLYFTGTAISTIFAKKSQQEQEQQQQQLLNF